MYLFQYFRAKYLWYIKIQRKKIKKLKKCVKGHELFKIQCSPAYPAQAGEEAVGLSGLSGLPSNFCVLVGE